MADRPKRIVRRRLKGWKNAPGVKYCGRGSRFGNAFIVGGPLYPMSPALAVACFRAAIETDGGFYPDPQRSGLFTTVEDIRRELRGCDLSCWCELDEICHVDVLLEVANA